MASAWRKMAVYLGLVEDDRHLEGYEYEYEDDYEDRAPVPVPDDDARPNIGQDPAIATKRKVMVIYGHDDEANRALFSWLRAIGLELMEWSQLVQLSGNASPYVGEVLEQAFKNAQAVVAFFTPDEHVAGRGVSLAEKNSWRLQARPNVLIEAGMALVTHPQHTIFVVLGSQELPSDLAGRHYIRLNNTSGPLYELANRLADAGCELSRTGTQWLDPATFPNRDNFPVSPSQRAKSAARPKQIT